MDDEGFDRLTRMLSTAVIARRGAVRRLLAGALGLSLGAVATSATAAKKRKKKKKKAPPCQPDCAGKNCGANGCNGSCGSCTQRVHLLRHRQRRDLPVPDDGLRRTPAAAAARPA